MPSLITREVAGSERGMALVLALAMVAFLVAVAVQLVGKVDRQLEAAVNLRDTVRLDALVESGLDLALARLDADAAANAYDSLHDSWNTFENLAELAGGAALDVEVIDLSGRLQVNALVKEAKQRTLWLRLLTSGRLAIDDEDQAVSLLDALMDWLDKDDSTRDQGAETGYYKGLSPPYVSPNSSIQRLDELLLIKGFSRDILYGNDTAEGLVDYISEIDSKGKININTAPARVLQLLADDLDEEAVGELVDFRKEKENIKLLASPSWYRQVGGFPDDIILDRGLLTTESQGFRVTVTAESNGLRRSGMGLVLRKDNQLHLKWWQVE
ncbi:MAG: hypothetical protein CSA34_02820 [Desulfobulbus propionicus]|nr:MAG: hypothetical protein CSA34_02820 [Desulfobulbus propionicus]